ncbi:MAG: OmpA family protein [Thiotrichales bacterium]
MNILRTTALASSLALLSACATDDPNQRAKIGAAVGAVTGAVIGNQTGNDRTGRVVGAVAGAAAGAAIGKYMDDQQRELEEQLAAEQRRNEIELERIKEDTLKINLNSEVSFDFDSAQLKPGFFPTLDKLAKIIRDYENTTVRIVGHTDSVGSAEYNQRLSEKRAQAVADYLSQQGVSYSRIRTEGRGESEPRADNSTEAGRQLNRRVEVFLQSNGQ